MIPASNAIDTLNSRFFELYPGEAARLCSMLTEKQIIGHFERAPMPVVVEVYSRLNPELAMLLTAHMSDDIFRELFTLLDPTLAARLLSQLDKEAAESKISLLLPSLATEIRDLMSYPAETAGRLMDTRVIVFNPEDSVDFVLTKIRSVKNKRIVNVNITDETGLLVGSIPLQYVAGSEPDEKLKTMMSSTPVAIQAMSPVDEVVQMLEEQKLLSLPVVDIEGKLLGVIRNDALLNAAKMDASEDLQMMFGAGRDEQALSKISFAIRKRLPWLQINLATAFLAAAVVGFFEETIAKITVLAVFLPVVAGQSGNTGSQALAVTMRGLALREIRTRHWLKVARKEISVGFLNGVAVALTTSVIIFFWADSLALSLVIAVAMVFSMVIAGFSGAVIPIILKAVGQDPAQSSSIILTTVTDIAGFLSFLGLATLMMGYLNIG